MRTGMRGGMRCANVRGFTLIEVMVALVIVAFGMGAVLAALSSAAGNIAALHDKTLAQWIALNQVADTRLNLQVPTAGTTEGDIKAFGNADWHWQQDIVPVPSIPGLLEITVRVRRTGSSSSDTRTGEVCGRNLDHRGHRGRDQQLRRKPPAPPAHAVAPPKSHPFAPDAVHAL